MEISQCIREIGRGRHAARSLGRNDALTLARAMIAGEVPDLQLGAILLAMRMKGESQDEISAFLEAANEVVADLAPPPGLSAPIVIPSYNGARKLPNLTPLLALLLAKRSVPVLVHGVRDDAGRIATREVFEALNIPTAVCVEDAVIRLERDRVAFLPIDLLAPKLTRLLEYRRVLGVRNSFHSVVKLLQPFAGPALRLVSVTHPDYLSLMRDLFAREGGYALLLRGAEGEVVASVRRIPEIDWWAKHEKIAHDMAVPTVEAELELPKRDAHSTARWIERVLAGEIPVPAAIGFQVELTCRAATAVASPARVGAPAHQARAL